MPGFAEHFVARCLAGLEGRADPDRAAAMARYMQDQFPFLGIPAPAQREVFRQALAGLPRPAAEDLHEAAELLWEAAPRECQYLACSLLRRFARQLEPASLRVVRHFLVAKPWWDTVDALAAHAVGPLVLRFPSLAADVDAWAAGEDGWLARAAILHQLTFKERTDEARLFRACLLRANDPWFFSRKAIGWALREYAKTNPAAVRAFVGAHAAELSPLSKREALRRLIPAE